MRITLAGWVLLIAGCGPLSDSPTAPAGPALTPTATTAPASQPTAPAVDIVYIAEMGQIEQLRRWARSEPSSDARQAAQAAEVWKRLAPLLRPQLTADKVRGLSRWAKPQMEKYLHVAPLAGAKLAVVATEPGGTRRLLEATIETLPTHSPAVTRWLRVYVPFDPATAAAEKAIVTIQGERLE
jgi:hypothetical protein